ncbi:MAG: IPT/TIG domain-containing protein [Aliidongia sp.]
MHLWTFLLASPFLLTFTSFPVFPPLPPFPVRVSPVITGLTPANGATTGGATVTISGLNFVGVKGVSFGSNPAQSFTVNNTNSITAVSPISDTEISVDVSVSTKYGINPASISDKFSYISSLYSCLRNFYVSPTGLDTNDGSISAPWQTLAWAGSGSAGVTAGDCVNFEDGTYAITEEAIIGAGGSTNMPTGYVTYRALDQGQAKFLTTMPLGSINDDIIHNASSYVIFDGFEVDGGNEGIADPNAVLTIGNCISSVNSHHVMVLNSILHDCGASGISGIFGEWYTFDNNTVYNNSFFNTNQTSGISIFEPNITTYTATSADINAMYQIIIQNNVVYNNWEQYVPGSHTDGNGIILDDFDNSQGTNPNVDNGTIYPSPTLVQHNTVYGNGGKGIHLFSSQNVTVDANEVYGNNFDTANPTTEQRGEMSNTGAGNDVGTLCPVVVSASQPDDSSSNNIWTNNNATTTNSATTPPFSQNVAVGDQCQNLNVTWTGNATYDTRTGMISYNIDTPARAAAFPANNPLGGPLP